MDGIVDIKSQILLWTIVATLLQVGGTVVLALFSFYGIEIVESNPEAYMELTPKVTINRRWLRAAQCALVALVFGMVLSGVVSFAGVS